MSKYRKKPVVIEAIQWTKLNNDEIAKFMGIEHVVLVFQEKYGLHLVINTLEGQMYADVGDYIIKGVKGEFYPCKPDIFEQTYEAVEE